MSWYARLGCYLLDGWRWFWRNKWKILIISIVVALCIALSYYYISNRSKAKTIDKQKTELATQQKAIEQLSEEIKYKNTELLTVSEQIKIAKETIEKNKIIIEQTQLKIEEYSSLAKAIAQEQDEKKKKQATADYLNKLFGVKTFTSKQIK